MIANEQVEAGRRRTVSRRPRVILAEDDDPMRLLLARTLERAGFEVLEASSGAELATLLRAPPGGRAADLVVTDNRMPWATGLTVLAGMRTFDPVTPVVLITAFGDQATHEQAIRLGAAAIFDKPFDLYELRSAALRLVGGL